ncbi:MAG: PglZ domain-containing protein [Muribaculaceae bacterium]|nr:PglZ domain-containing protein [Muribaculaceae bacterium]
MIGFWFKEDVERILAEHRYVVVTDANGEGDFLLKYLPEDIKQIPISNEYSEIEAKYLAESEYADSPVLFYARKKAVQLTFLQEYVQTGGLLVLDDMEAYIKQKLFEATGRNTHLAKDKLLLAAKLSEGKNMNWWQSVADGITEPLRLEDWLLDFLHAPVATQGKMDETVWNVFRSEVYRLIDKPQTEQPAEAMAQEVVNTILQSLADNTIEGLLLEVYYQWADSTEKIDTLRKYADNYALPADINPLKAHPNHPFAPLDRQLMMMLSNAMKLHQDTKGLTKFIKQRTQDRKAKAFKPLWLLSVLQLCTFKVEGLGQVDTYQDMATYYRLHFASLDTAMRRIYTAWLNEPATLRPLQEHYTILNNELLTYWFGINDKYIATQKDIVMNALSGDIRTAVIVCDGLRLEIAEAIVNGITDKNVKIDRKTALTVLPSVTENGMSALFGCSEPTMNAQSRFNTLKSIYDDVVIMPLNMLNDSVTAQRLVLNYGDIDEVGEKKQMGALKDITNYEPELREKIAHLFRLGYNKIVLTTDHGFVLTGLLDEADKEPRPEGNILKIEERFVLTEEPLTTSNLIERAGRYFNSNYQYYAKTDKPFKTTGRYGYSHGGFTPQECIIPAYELNIETNNMALGVMISNKKELKAVIGNYFTVKLLAEGCESDLFRNERKVKLLLFAGNKMVSGNQIFSMKPGETIHAEFEMTRGIDKVVLVDKETSVQIDSCNIIKSASRDLDDLL